MADGQVNILDKDGNPIGMRADNKDGLFSYIQGNRARARSANPAAAASADWVDILATLTGVQIVRPYSLPELDWSYTAAAGGATTNADIAVAAAAGAGLRNYMTWLTVTNMHATVETEIVVKDGVATVLYRDLVKPVGVAPLRITFPSPLKTSANAVMNVACVTTGSKVYFNCGGYVAP